MTLTLDEIEVRLKQHIDSLRTPEGYLRIGAERRPLSIDDALVAEDALLAMVAHVRALENITRMTDDKALERIAALEERAAALEAHCGAQLKLHHDALAREVNTEVLVGQEMEIARLREENARLQKLAEELREKLAKTAEALDNTRQTSFRTAVVCKRTRPARPEPSRGS